MRRRLRLHPLVGWAMLAWAAAGCLRDPVCESNAVCEAGEACVNGACRASADAGVEGVDAGCDMCPCVGAETPGGCLPEGRWDETNWDECTWVE